jgi:hypothetical protein
MQEDLENTIALLERTPGALDALLRGLPEMWTENGEGEKSEGEQTWNARMVVAHLVHCEHEDWMPRARMILERGEQQVFDPLDREGSVRAGASEEPGGTARVALDAGGFRAAGTASGIWRGDAFATAGHVGGARFDAPASDFADHGLSISRGGGAVEPVSGRDAVQGAQRIRREKSRE